jgi:alpha-D-ribose 1-methylphosphonate 5-triphosphate synthase subunit PhnH
VAKKHRPVSRRRFLQYSSLGLAGLATLGDLALITPKLALGANPITVENSNPGSTNWNITNLATDTGLQIAGYASATSVNKGGSINFFVTVNTAQNYSIEIYRMGWYNGTGGRLMQTISNLSGVKQTVPAPNSFGTVACTWPVAYTLNVPTTWTTGAYLAKLTNAAGFQNYIYFVVRDDAATSDLMFQCSVNTYQAYNNLGGKSLYPDDSTGGVAAVKVSFDRPLTNYAMSFFLSWELPTLRLIEKNGYDVSYCTNIDLDTNPALMSNRKGFISLGHDEYWSKAMYDNAVAFRDSGKHLAFLGANTIYWQIRFENSNRLITCYKDSFTQDPQYPGPLTTYLWRELPSTYSRPENGLIGVMYDGYNNNDPGAPFVVTNSSHWVYANSGLTNSSKITGIVGYEWDKRFSNGAEPAGLVQLSNSPVTPVGATTSSSQATIYQASSGAWVFATGTIFWAYAMDYIPGYHPSNLTNAGLQRVMLNVLDKFVGSTPPPPAPAISSLSPTSATQGGAAFTLTVNGSNFVSGATVKWNGSARTTTFNSATQLTASITANDLTSAGIFPITVTNPDNQTSNALNFNVTASAPAPAITTLSPANTLQGGVAFTLTVNGSNFVTGAVVKWNGANRTTIFVSSTQLQGNITAADIASAGTFPITVANPDTQISNAVNFTVSPPPAPAPAITTLSPTSAAQNSAGFTLTVNGSNFVNGASVRWNGNSRATAFVSATQLTATIASSDLLVAGSFPITVANPDNQTSNAVNFTVTAAPSAPAITTLSPSSATQGGAAFTLTVNGSNFVSGAIVRWNGANRTTTFVSATQLRASITAADIASTGTFPVTVINPNNQTSNAVNFTVTAATAPTVTSLSPSSAIQGGAAFSLTVNGTNFVSGAVVKWNGANRTTTFVSSTQLRASITAADIATAGTAAVTVTNPNNQTSNSVNFTITAATGSPTITSLSPNQKVQDVDDFNMIVTGSNFVSGAVVRWNGANRPTTFISSTQLRAFIENAQTLVIGSFPVTVRNPDGKISNAVNFTIVPDV